MKEIIQYFLTIGLLGFGGPMAHIAMMDEGLIERRRWATKEQFLDAIALCNMLPGPASTQLGIYMGYVRAGVLGAVVAGISFILPAFVMMVILSYLYFSYGQVPAIRGIVYGVNAVAIALIANSLLKMRKKSIGDSFGYIVFALSAVAIYVFDINLLIAMLLAGVAGVIYYGNASQTTALHSFTPFVWLVAIQPSFGRLMRFFLKVGAFIYGGGLVIIPFIEREVVEQLGWMTRAEFITGISFGQVTPGPVVITSAFIGYKVMGLAGAMISTAAIFAPSFAFIILLAPHLERAKRFMWFKHFLKAVNASVIGLILAALLRLIPGGIVDLPTLCITIVSFLAVWRCKVNVFVVVACGAGVGLIASYLL